MFLTTKWKTIKLLMWLKIEKIYKNSKSQNQFFKHFPKFIYIHGTRLHFVFSLVTPSLTPCLVLWYTPHDPLVGLCARYQLINLNHTLAWRLSQIMHSQICLIHFRQRFCFDFGRRCWDGSADMWRETFEIW